MLTIYITHFFCFVFHFRFIKSLVSRLLHKKGIPLPDAKKKKKHLTKLKTSENNKFGVAKVIESSSKNDRKKC